MKQRPKTSGYIHRPSVPFVSGRNRANTVAGGYSAQTPSGNDTAAETQDATVSTPPTHSQRKVTARRSISQSEYAAFRAMSKIVHDTVEYRPETVTAAYPLPMYSAPERPKLVKKKLPWGKFALRATAFALVLVIATGGVLAYRGYRTAGKVLAGSTTVAVLGGGTTVEPQLLKGEGDGRVNILLLGIGGEGHDGSDLTDTMMLASVDPVNKTTTLVSIPRDMWVKMPVNFFGQHQKINAAYSSGKYKYIGRVDTSNANKEAIKAGFSSVDTAVSQVLGVRVDYNLLVNFQGFEKAIDTVGGIDVDVKEPLVDASMAWENGNNAVLVPAGAQTMDGKKALLYARSRHTSSDFARSERQRQIIMALKNKVLTTGVLSNPMRLASLSQSFGDTFYSDLSTDAAQRLFLITKDISADQTKSLDLVTGDHSLVMTDRVGDISVVRPKLGFETYSDIQAYIAQNLRDGFILRENAGVAVIAPTEENAKQELTVLKGLGYTTTGTVKFGGATGTSQAILVDLSSNASPYTLHYLENHYGKARPASVIPANVVVPEGTQFVILLET